MQHDYLHNIKELSPLFEGADYTDSKTIEGNVDLRQFLVGLISFTPGWVKLLYAIRAAFVRLLGLRQEHFTCRLVSPEEISFTPGDSLGFFTVTHGKDNEHIAAVAKDKHLDAHIVVAAAPLPQGGNRFYVGTIVHYNNWSGPLYFNIIRPFHHLVMRRMMLAGIRRQ